MWKILFTLCNQIKYIPRYYLCYNLQCILLKSALNFYTKPSYFNISYADFLIFNAEFALIFARRPWFSLKFTGFWSKVNFQFMNSVLEILNSRQNAAVTRTNHKINAHFLHKAFKFQHFLCRLFNFQCRVCFDFCERPLIFVEIQRFLAEGQSQDSGHCVQNPGHSPPSDMPQL